MFLRDGKIIARNGGQERVVMTREDIRLPGEHNVENYLAGHCRSGRHGKR